MRVLIILTSLHFAYFVYGLYLSQSSFQVIAPGLKQENPENFYDYRGVINVQTHLSLGSSSAADVIEEAKKADLDFYPCSIYQANY